MPMQHKIYTQFVFVSFFIHLFYFIFFVGGGGGLGWVGEGGEGGWVALGMMVIVLFCTASYPFLVFGKHLTEAFPGYMYA